VNDSTRQLLEKAGRAIEAAETLLGREITEFAAGRAYYAMFYTAEALLNEQGLRFRKHGQVQGAFGQHFVKTGVFDATFHRWLLTAFNRRIIGDYGLEEVITLEEAAETIRQAQEFLQAARRYLEP